MRLPGDIISSSSLTECNVMKSDLKIDFYLKSL